MKWLLIGNFKTLQSNGLMRTNSWQYFIWELANELILSTCFMPLIYVNEFWLTALFWKMMGACIGKRTMIKPDVLLFEADLLEIGDDCQIEENATLLCHKFSNGGLELAPVVIPSNTYVGHRAVILPGCKIVDENVQILPLTHVLPSEELTAGTWFGSPAEKLSSTGWEKN